MAIFNIMLLFYLIYFITKMINSFSTQIFQIKIKLRYLWHLPRSSYSGISQNWTILSQFHCYNKMYENGWRQQLTQRGGENRDWMGIGNEKFMKGQPRFIYGGLKRVQWVSLRLVNGALATFFLSWHFHIQVKMLSSLTPVYKF